jgi:predicted Zn-dependent protease
LAAAGVPASGYITGLGAQLVEAAYSRDDEREADMLGIDYMIANSFDPLGRGSPARKTLQAKPADWNSLLEQSPERRRTH